MSAIVESYVLVAGQYMDASDEQEIDEIGEVLDELWSKMSGVEQEEARGRLTLIPKSSA